MFRLSFAALLVLTMSGFEGRQPASRQASATEDEALLATAYEFPTADAQVWGLVATGARERLLARALANDPASAETVRVLMGRRRFDDALKVLRAIIDSHPEQMAAAFTALASNSGEMLADGARNYRDPVRSAVADARRRGAALPREQAAKLALSLVNIDTELGKGPERWRTNLRAFASEYAGTEAALLAQVDLLTDRVSSSTLNALEAFAAEHPGTNAAAKALYTKGFHLGHNAFSLGEREGQDPTDRFFRALATANELRSGRYPPSEWVDRALALVTEFYAYKPTYAPGNADRILSALEELLPELLRAYEQDPSKNSISYVITSRMGELFRTTGNAVARIEGVFDRLEHAGANPGAVRTLKAEFYLRPSERAVDADDRTALLVKAEATLESLVREGTGIYQRRALATLARMRFGAGEYDAARTLYGKYVAAYPQSSYAWVAALRVAQSEAAHANVREAANLFRNAVDRFGTNPVARVLAHAYAARALEAADDFAQALVSYRSALAAWDVDYGLRYSLYAMRPASPGDQWRRVDDVEVARESLVERVSELERTMRGAGGALVERGRWLVGQGRREDAIASLSKFLTEHRRSPLVAEARLLAHRARLEQALELMDADKQAVDIDAALKALRTLSAEPPDYAVCAARIALATLTALSRPSGEADAIMADALTTWKALDRPAAPPARTAAVDRDIVEIRNVVFRPKGDGVYRTGREWNAFKWDSGGSPYFVVDPVLRVKSASGEITTVVAYDAFPEYANVLFLDDRRRALLERVMLKLGGTKRRAWTQVMQTPNQPAGASLDVLAFWKKSFWAQPGHWGGWVFETYPIIGEIEFVNAERTKAAVKVTVGYSGATVQLEKKNGAWIARELTNFWIT